MKGQFSTEFIILLSFVLILFVISIVIYTMNVREANSFAKTLEAQKICMQVSSSITSFASLGGNSTFTFNLPKYIDYENYTIWIVSEHKLVRVDFEDAGVGCKFQTTNISHVNGSVFFQLEKNATLKNYNGVLIVEQ